MSSIALFSDFSGRTPSELALVEGIQSYCAALVLQLAALLEASESAKTAACVELQQSEAARTALAAESRRHKSDSDNAGALVAALACDVHALRAQRASTARLRDADSRAASLPANAPRRWAGRADLSSPLAPLAPLNTPSDAERMRVLILEHKRKRLAEDVVASDAASSKQSGSQGLGAAPPLDPSFVSPLSAGDNALVVGALLGNDAEPFLEFVTIGKQAVLQAAAITLAESENAGELLVALACDLLALCSYPASHDRLSVSDSGASSQSANAPRRWAGRGEDGQPPVSSPPAFPFVDAACATDGASGRGPYPSATFSPSTDARSAALRAMLEELEQIVIEEKRAMAEAAAAASTCVTMPQTGFGGSLVGDADQTPTRMMVKASCGVVCVAWKSMPPLQITFGAAFLADSVGTAAGPLVGIPLASVSVLTPARVGDNASASQGGAGFSGDDELCQGFPLATPRVLDDDALAAITSSTSSRIASPRLPC